MKHEIQDALYRGISRGPVSLTLRIRSGGCGFFGDVAKALNGIRFAEENNLIARVIWAGDSLYFDPARGENVWEYYFTRSEFDFSTNSRHRVSLAVPYWPSSQDFHRYPEQSHRASLHQAIQRFCSVRPETTAAVQDYVDTHFSTHPVLGVHIRMTDAARGIENRRTLDVSVFATEIGAWLDAHPGGRIFVATDDADVLNYLTTKFGDRVHARDHIRSRTGVSIHGAYDSGTSGSPYQKGEEVLIDALLLAETDHLIRTHSRVTWFSL